MAKIWYVDEGNASGRTTSAGEVPIQQIAEGLARYSTRRIDPESTFSPADRVAGVRTRVVLEVQEPFLCVAPRWNVGFHHVVGISPTTMQRIFGLRR